MSPGDDPDVIYTTPPCPTAIVIGCPRSGTTLVQALLVACYNNVFTPHDPELRPTPWAVDQIPRDLPTLAVYKVPEMPLATAMEFREHMRDGAWVIAVVRDLRAMSSSRRADGVRFWETDRLANESWCRMARVVRKLEGYSRTLVVRFEDLILHPRDVQLTMAVRMNLTPTRLFEEGHTAMGGMEETKVKAMQGIRPLDPSRTRIDPTSLVSMEAADHLHHFHYPQAAVRLTWDEETDYGQHEAGSPGVPGVSGGGSVLPGTEDSQGERLHDADEPTGGDGPAGSGRDAVPDVDPSDVDGRDHSDADADDDVRGSGDSSASASGDRGDAPGVSVTHGTTVLVQATT